MTDLHAGNSRHSHNKSGDRADAYLPGPDPMLHRPDLSTAFHAEVSLRNAVRSNSSQNCLVMGISQDDAETLLDWITYTTRQALVATAGKKSQLPLFSPKYVEGRCGDAAAIAGFQAEMYGLPTRHHQLHEFTLGQYYGHAFNIVQIPIKSGDSVVLMPYLIDTTFRQFFAPDHAASSHWQNRWGKKLVETEGGRALADTLLRKGYAALTPEALQLYLSSSDIDRHLGTHFQEDYRGLLPRMLSQNTTTKGYLFHDTLDLRSPEMVTMHQPTSAAAYRHAHYATLGDASWWDINPLHEMPDTLREDRLYTRDSDNDPGIAASYARMRPDTNIALPTTSRALTPSDIKRRA